MKRMKPTRWHLMAQTWRRIALACKAFGHTRIAAMILLLIENKRFTDNIEITIGAESNAKIGAACKRHGLQVGVRFELAGRA